MNFDDSPNQILMTLYAAPLQPELWNVFLEQLSAMSGVRKAALITHHVAEKNHKILATLGDSVKDEASIQLYEHFYFEFDEWTLRFPKGGTAGKIIQGEEVLSEASLLKSIFYNEFLKTVDVCRMACLTAVAAPGIFEALSIYRGYSEDTFDTEQLAILEMLAPHLRTALATRRRLLTLNSRVADLENALDQLKTALVLVDGRGKPVFVNRAAQRIFDLRDGLALSSFGLAALNSAETAQLRGIIAKALVAGTGNLLMHGGAMLISRANNAVYVVVALGFTDWVPRVVNLAYKCSLSPSSAANEIGSTAGPVLAREIMSPFTVGDFVGILPQNSGQLWVIPTVQVWQKIQ
jgi:PAS domain-containing protein